MLQILITITMLLMLAPCGFAEETGAAPATAADKVAEAEKQLKSYLKMNHPEQALVLVDKLLEEAREKKSTELVERYTQHRRVILFELSRKQSRQSTGSINAMDFDERIPLQVNLVQTRIDENEIEEAATLLGQILTELPKLEWPAREKLVHQIFNEALLIEQQMPDPELLDQVKREMSQVAQKTTDSSSQMRFQVEGSVLELLNGDLKKSNEEFEKAYAFFTANKVSKEWAPWVLDTIRRAEPFSIAEYRQWLNKKLVMMADLVGPTAPTQFCNILMDVALSQLQARDPVANKTFKTIIDVAEQKPSIVQAPAIYQGLLLYSRSHRGEDKDRIRRLLHGKP